MIIRTTGASLALLAVAGLTIAGARRAGAQPKPDAPGGAAWPPGRARSRGSMSHDGGAPDEEIPPTNLRREMSRRGIPDAGLNAEWSVSAWRVGAHNGEPAWLIDMEDGTYEVVNRYYLGEDGVYRGAKGRPMPQELASEADGTSDHIVVIRKGELSQPDAAAVATSVIQQFGKDAPKAHPAIRRES